MVDMGGLSVAGLTPRRNCWSALSNLPIAGKEAQGLAEVGLDSGFIDEALGLFCAEVKQNSTRVVRCASLSVESFEHTNREFLQVDLTESLLHGHVAPAAKRTVKAAEMETMRRHRSHSCQYGKAMARNELPKSDRETLANVLQRARRFRKRSKSRISESTV